MEDALNLGVFFLLFFILIIGIVIGWILNNSLNAPTAIISNNMNLPIGNNPNVPIIPAIEKSSTFRGISVGCNDIRYTPSNSNIITLIGKSEILMNGNDEFVRTTTPFGLDETSSMQPILDVNDILILCKPASENDIKVGSIVVFCRYNSPNLIVGCYLHRVIEISKVNGETTYKTQGDNTNSPDNIMPKFSQILYVVNGVIWR